MIDDLRGFLEDVSAVIGSNYRLLFPKTETCLKILKKDLKNEIVNIRHINDFKSEIEKRYKKIGRGLFIRREPDFMRFFRCMFVFLCCISIFHAFQQDYGTMSAFAILAHTCLVQIC